MRIVFVHMLCLVLLLTPSLAGAQAASPSPAPAASPAATSLSPVEIAKDRIDTMLRTGHADPAWFSASFLAQVPASKLDEIIASITSSLGKYKSVEFTPAKLIAHFASGTDGILIHLEDLALFSLLCEAKDLTSNSQDGRSEIVIHVGMVAV